MSRPTVVSAGLTQADIAQFEQFGISPELLEESGVRRVVDREARDVYGFRFNGNLDGILFPYITPAGERVNARIRRDHPEIENSKPKNKYVSAVHDHRRLYYPP